MKEVLYEGPPMDEARPESIERSKGSPVAPTIRTLQIDANEESKKTTRLGILMAQRARNEAAGRPRILEETGRTEHHFGRIIFILLLVLAFSVGVGMYALIGGRVPSTTTVPEENSRERKTETFTKSGATIAIGNASREQILTAISDAFRAGAVTKGEAAIVTFTTTDRSGSAMSATTTAIFSALDLVVHSDGGNLVRSLDSTMTYGFSAGETSADISGFLELHSRSYPETFAGMLRWEKAMAVDLIPILKPAMKKSEVTFMRGRTWSDERVGGSPARVLNDPDGIAVIAYAFLPDRKTLIITSGQETLRALIERAQNTNKQNP